MREEQNKIISDIVRNYMLKNPQLVSKVKINDEVLTHVIQTGTELLARKWGFLTYSGGFVNSIINNNLSETFGCADDINEQFVKFYVMLEYNVACPRELLDTIWVTSDNL